ncbi:MAG: LD-carboxypeptidase [Ignavibacterium sp.]|nr:LD-carboxypeptidase [Ignavibacterium sp.]
MNRKNFLKTVSTAAVGAGLLSSNSFAEISSVSKKSVIKPKRLKTGDTIGLVAPGSYISELELKDSIKNLEELGFKVVYTEKILLQNGYFSGTDEQRAEDLINMFKRNEVAGIVCTRGGYGCARILPLLDYDIIEDNPKVLIGYSDITALHYGIFRKTGLITFHGPVSISTFNEFSVNNFKNVLMNPSNEIVFENSNSGEDENPYGVVSIAEGKKKGKLIGGNLSIAVSLIGTEFDVDYDDAIIYLEEVGEEPYRIDRMLTQMIQSEKFEDANGVAMGIFRKCEPKITDPSFSKSFSLMDVLQDRLGNLKVPVVYGMSFGHIKDKFTIPFGVEAELDSEKQTITLMESPVI